MSGNSTSGAIGEHKVNLHSTFTMCISIILIIVNIIPIWIIISTRKIRRIMSNKFLLNLLLSHFTVGVMYLIPIVIPLLQNERLIIFSVNSGSEIIALFAMIVLTIDRFVCIMYPFIYNNIPKWLSYFIMLLCWLLGAIYLIIGVTLSVYNKMNVQIVFLVIASILLILLLVSNSLIFRETRRHIKVISASITPDVEFSNTIVHSNDHISASSNDKAVVIYTENNELNKQSSKDLKKRFIQKKEIRAAYICILMVISYVIFWAPFFVISFVDNLYTGLNLERTIYLTIMNSIADPVIYITFNREVRSIITKRITIMFLKTKTMLPCI